MFVHVKFDDVEVMTLIGVAKGMVGVASDLAVGVVTGVRLGVWLVAWSSMLFGGTGAGSFTGCLSLVELVLGVWLAPTASNELLLCSVVVDSTSIPAESAESAFSSFSLDFLAFLALNAFMPKTLSLCYQKRMT